VEEEGVGEDVDETKEEDTNEGSGKEEEVGVNGMIG
jgi:hypothetical protein